MNKINLDKFHDWIIGPIITNWVDENINITLELDKKYNIEIINFKKSSILRFLPWGESQYINQITQKKVGIKTLILKIEMQSGDILEFEGSEIKINEIPG